MTILLEKYWKKASFFSLTVLKSWKKWTYRRKNVSLKWSNGLSDCSFNNLDGTLIWEAKNFNSMSKGFKKHNVCQKKRLRKTFYPWNVRTDMLTAVLTTLRGNFCSRPKKFSPWPKLIKRTVVYQKQFVQVFSGLKTSK